MKNFFKKIIQRISQPVIILNDLFYEFDQNSFHFGKLYMYFFGKPFSLYEIEMKLELDDEKFIAKLQEQYSVPERHIFRTDIAFDKSLKKRRKATDYKLSLAFIILKEGLAVSIKDSGVLILYDHLILKSEILKIAALTDEFKIPEKTPVKKFYMVTIENGHLSLSGFDVKSMDLNIDDNYNDDFKLVDKIIFDSLTANDKSGLVFLHGTYGTGKTYYIRHLINSINKKFIYLPNNMMNWLTNPDFLPFISNYHDSILILEDCEKLLMCREEGNSDSAAISELLNLGDGLLSDALSLNIICTFNANITKIDDALLRKGRIIARYEFKELELPKAQALADKLDKKMIIKKPMTLSDIYNADSMEFENKKINKIGFVYP